MSAAVRRSFCLLLLPLWMPGPLSQARPPAASPAHCADYVARLEAALLIQTLNTDLLTHDSATQTLERWCATHKLASPARIVAERIPGLDRIPTAEQRQELGISASEPVRYRHVRLRCGDLTLAEADNWYVPARLTPDMNRTLDTTDTPFGRAVQALHFQRRTLSARMLAPLLPEGWEMRVDIPQALQGPAPLPARVLQHRAILALPDGSPISEVVETYTANVLAFPIRGVGGSCKVR